MKEKLKNLAMSIIGGENKNRTIFLIGMGVILLLAAISYFVGR